MNLLVYEETQHTGSIADFIIKLPLDHFPVSTEPFCRVEVTLHETTVQFQWKLINTLGIYGKDVGNLGELLRKRIINMKF